MHVCTDEKSKEPRVDLLTISRHKMKPPLSTDHLVIRPAVPVGISDGVYLEFDVGFSLLCVLNRPAPQVVQEFIDGESYYDIGVKDDIIFIGLRFGTLDWMEIPFNIHLYPDSLSLLVKPAPTQEYSVHAVLLDSATNTIEAQLMINFSHDFSMCLYDAIIHQPVIPDYAQRLQNVMARYSEKDIPAWEVSEIRSDMVANRPKLRPSHRGINGINNDNYPLPVCLHEFNYFYSDGTGHVVMAVPESLLPQAIKSGDYDGYECPIPCRYVIANGFRFHEGYVVCDVPYNKEFGVDLDESWYDE